MKKYHTYTFKSSACASSHSCCNVNDQLIRLIIAGHGLGEESGEDTSLKTGYMTAYNVIETIELVSASFFISSIVILNTFSTTWDEMLNGTGGSRDPGNPLMG